MNLDEREIATAISRQVLARKCVVLVDRCNWTGYECDVLAVTTDLRIIDVEIKISRGDLKADAKKDKWWRRTEPWQKFGDHWQHRSLEEPTRRNWPEKVWKHYYAMPAEIWRPELMKSLPSPASGVILLREQKYDGVVVASVERRAKPNRDADRLTPEQVMDIARLANLRMWHAYERVKSATRQGEAA